MLDNRTDSKANWLLGAAKTGDVFGAIMMSSLVKGLGRLMALLTQLRLGERTMGSLGSTRECLVAGDGGSCFLKLLTGGKDAAGAVTRRERGYPGIRVKTHAGTQS